MLFTAACTLSCTCLQQLVSYFKVIWLTIFFKIFFCDIHCHSVACSSSQLPAVADQFELILSATSLFQSKVVIKHCQKECVHSLVVNTIQKCKEKWKYSIRSTHSFYTSLFTVGYSPYVLLLLTLASSLINFFYSV